MVLLAYGACAEFRGVECDADQDTYITRSKQIHAYVDGYHAVTKDALSRHVEVDTRIGLRENGIDHEPLEQVLLYLGLSMHKDQISETRELDEDGYDIDSVEVKHTLLRGNAAAARHWYHAWERRSKKEK
jgi:hypothetical protein